MNKIKDYKYIKNKNKWTVFRHILQQAPISRAELARITEMSPTTITRIAKELMSEGYIRETEEGQSSKVGRKAINLDLVNDSVITIGVFIDKFTQYIGLLGLNNELLAIETYILHTDDPTLFIEELCEKIDQFLIKKKINEKNVLGIGMGIPGMIDSIQGTVQLSATLGWGFVQVVSEVEKRLRIDTVIDNELKVRALAETQFGNIKESGNTSIISFGSGVGSALIVNNQVYRGATNSAGEIGHTIANLNGRTCECGKKGCLQTYIVESELIKQAQQYEEIQNLDQLFQSYSAGVPWAKQIIDQAVHYIQVTIANVVCMYNPDTIIIDGLLIDKLRENHIDIIHDRDNTYIWEPLEKTFSIHYSLLGNKGVSIGAGLLVQHHFFELE